MELVPENTHMVLQYVQVLNRFGVHPTREEVEAYAVGPLRPRSMVVGFDLFTGIGESHVDFMARLGWLEDQDGGGVMITPLGVALLRGLNAPAADDNSVDVFEVALGPGDPFAYSRAIGKMSSVRDALLVDPYLRPQQLGDVLTYLPNITRALMTRHLNRGERTEMFVAVAAARQQNQQMQVRVLAKGRIHDRFLIPRGHGNVLMFGTSLHGIGDKFSIITSLGESLSDIVRSRHEEYWNSAAVLEAQ